MEPAPESIMLIIDNVSYIFSNKNINKLIDTEDNDNLVHYTLTYELDRFQTIYKQFLQILRDNNQLVKVKRCYSPRARLLVGYDDFWTYDTVSNYPEAKNNVGQPLLTEINDYSVSSATFCENNQIDYNAIDFILLNVSTSAIQHNFTTNERRETDWIG